MLGVLSEEVNLVVGGRWRFVVENIWENLLQAIPFVASCNTLRNTFDNDTNLYLLIL
jgi:hypothetical protein